MAVAAIPWIIAGVAAIGALKQAQTESANAKAQAGALDYNAEVARQQASTALSESTAAQLAQRRNANQVMARSRAAAVQAGVGTGGSVGDVLGQSETLAELDALNIAYEGEMRARGFQTQASLDTFNAGIARTNAKAAKTQGYFRAISAFGGAAAGSFAGASAPKSTVTGAGGYSGGYSLGGEYSSSVGLRPYGSSGLRYS